MICHGGKKARDVGIRREIFVYIGVEGSSLTILENLAIGACTYSVVCCSEEWQTADEKCLGINHLSAILVVKVCPIRNNEITMDPGIEHLALTKGGRLRRSVVEGSHGIDSLCRLATSKATARALVHHFREVGLFLLS